MFTKILALTTTALAVALLTGCSSPADSASGTSGGDKAAQSPAAKPSKSSAAKDKPATKAAKPAKPTGPKKLADQGWTVESNALRNDGLGDFGAPRGSPTPTRRRPQLSR